MANYSTISFGGVTLIIDNNGDGDATGVDFYFSADGGILSNINETSDGIITSIPAGTSWTNKLSFFGFGQVDIVATVDEVTVIETGFVLFFFVIILP